MNAVQSTFSLPFVIRKHRLLKNGEAPIYLRMTVNGEVVDITVKRSVRTDVWDQRRECSTGKLHHDKELNHYLETLKMRLYQIHREFEIDGKRITAKALRDRYYGKDDTVKTLMEVYREHNQKCRALIGIDYSKATVEKFDTSLSHLQEYMRHQYGRDDLLLSELNGQFVSDFDFYLKTVRKCQNNSAIKHLKSLKKVVRIALANDWLKKDPFYGIQFKHEEKHIAFLTQQELETLMNKEFTLPRLELVRDVFVFCAFTALAFIDVKNLTREHLTRDNNGTLWIRKPRQKTGNTSNIPVLSVTQRLIDKYADHPECVRKNVLLPVMSNQKMNAYLKELADLCGITKRLSTHVARYTAATVVFLANQVSIENVAKILGHSNTKMTQHYAKVLDSSIMRDMANVENCFANSQNRVSAHIQ
jgi:site-specific recombinase XerD